MLLFQQNLQPSGAYVLQADAGHYDLTGWPATFDIAGKTPASGGYFAPMSRPKPRYTFRAASMLASRKIEAMQGRYRVTGTDADMLAERLLDSDTFVIDASLRDFLDLVMLDAMA